MAASIEPLYIELEYPNVEMRKSQLSLDTYHKSVCGYNRQQLGRILNTNFLGVGIIEKKIWLLNHLIGIIIKKMLV